MCGFRMELNISYYRGVLYLEEENVGYDLDTVATYKGHRFEALCSTANPDGSRDDAVVDMHTLWNTVVTRYLGSLKILLVGEVDCVKAEYLENPGPDQYMELKTRKLERRYKLTNRDKWDIQAHLLGISKIFVGFPDAEGIVKEVETISVRNSVARRYKIDWGARVLHALRKHCERFSADGDTLKVWRVRLDSERVHIRELGSAEVRKLNEAGVPRNGIIPVSFIEGLEKKLAT